jgi:hypothetical protein
MRLGKGNINPLSPVHDKPEECRQRVFPWAREIAMKQKMVTKNKRPPREGNSITSTGWLIWTEGADRKLGGKHKEPDKTFPRFRLY